MSSKIPNTVKNKKKYYFQVPNILKIPSNHENSSEETPEKNMLTKWTYTKDLQKKTKQKIVSHSA